MEKFYDVLKYFIKKYWFVLLFEIIIIISSIIIIDNITNNIMKTILSIGILSHIIVIIHFFVDTYKDYDN